MSFIPSYTQGYVNVWYSPIEDTVILMFPDASGAKDDDRV
jgi:hypothetical protein